MIKKIVNYLALIVAVLLIFVASMAFFLSFHNIQNFAELVGVDRRWSWVLAVMIDTAMLVFSLSALLAVLQKRFTWVLHASPVFVTAAVSIAFNVWQPQTSLMLSVAKVTAHVVPPVLLLLAFESNMQNIKSWLVSADATGRIERTLRWRANIILQSARRWRERARAAEHQLSLVNINIADLSELQNQITRLTQSNVALQEQNNTLSNANAGLRKQNEDLTVARASLSVEFSTLADTCADLREQNEVLTADAQILSSIPPLVADIAKSYAAGIVPNGNIVDVHPISQTDLARFVKAVSRSKNQ